MFRYVPYPVLPTQVASRMHRSAIVAPFIYPFFTIKWKSMALPVSFLGPLHSLTRPAKHF